MRRQIVTRPLPYLEAFILNPLRQILTYSNPNDTTNYEYQ